MWPKTLQGLVHYSWVQSSGWHQILPAGRWFRIRNDEIWIFHCRTVERTRGRGIYSAVLRQIMSDSLQANKKRAIIYTSSENISSQRGIQKAGFTLTGEYRAMNLYGIWMPISHLKYYVK